MPDTIDPLAKFRPSGAENATRLQASQPGRKQPYVAWRASTEAKRYLDLRGKFPEPTECPANAMITSIRGEWRRGLAITLSYGQNMMVQIKGRRLQEVFQMLKEWRVEWIEEFDPRVHAQPTDAKAPFIKSITIITEPPETPPPMQKRH